MAVKDILRMGHPILLQKSQPVTDFNSVELDTLIQDMWDSMQAARGAGLAAPQIGELQRVVIFGFENNPRYPDAEAVPPTVLINPEIKVLSQQIDDQWEGCLSIPGMRGLVTRHSKIHYSGFDQNGKSISRNVDGFHARVVQHECDHLDGILYPQRMTEMQSFGFVEELESSGQFQPQPCDD